MWVFGFHPVREALRAGGGEVLKVLMSRERDDARAQEIESLCADAEVPFERIDDGELSSLVDGVHNGLAALVERAAPRDRGESELVVLVEDVQDPRNLGALIRVCDGAGVDRLLIRDRGSATLTAAAIKTSAGAAEWLTTERITNTALEIERLQSAGHWVYGAAEGGLPPWEIDFTGKVMLCIGGEQKGLRRRTREVCDGLVELPMLGRVESLNLATAASAILYEAVRQRTGGGS